MKNSLRFLTNKILILLSILVTVVIITFLLVEFSPIDPIQSYIGDAAITITPEQRKNIAESWGLHQAPIKRLITWFVSLIQGDFGISYVYRQPVIHLIWYNFKSSFILLFISWLLSGMIGFVLGIIAGIVNHSMFDRLIKFLSALMNSTPVFWVGLVLMYILAVRLRLLPIALSSPIGVLTTQVTLLDRMYHAILPIIVLTITSISDIILYTRERVIKFLNSPPVLYAQARGMKKINLIKYHVIRQTLIPAITIHFSKIGGLFSGAIVIEYIFSYPGLGQLTVNAGLTADLPLLLGIVIFSAIFVFTGNTVADILYRWVDPRIESIGGELVE